MGYFIYNKIEKRNVEYFEKLWLAAEALRDFFVVPDGYTFKKDVYIIVDEEGNEAELSEEEQKPYSLSVYCGEIPERNFDENGLNPGAIEFYDRLEYFDERDDAIAALNKYESTKIKHKGYDTDIITFRRYFVEAIGKNGDVFLQDYSEKAADWRGEEYSDYNCYNF